jgi:hypothetical protein
VIEGDHQFRHTDIEGDTLVVPEGLTQGIELPEIDMQVSHYILQQCDCPNCGKTVKATLPSDVSTGYPRLVKYRVSRPDPQPASRMDA